MSTQPNFETMTDAELADYQYAHRDDPLGAGPTWRTSRSCSRSLYRCHSGCPRTRPARSRGSCRRGWLLRAGSGSTRRRRALRDEPSHGGVPGTGLQPHDGVQAHGPGGTLSADRLDVQPGGSSGHRPPFGVAGLPRGGLQGAPCPPAGAGQSSTAVNGSIAFWSFWCSKSQPRHSACTAACATCWAAARLRAETVNDRVVK